MRLALFLLVLLLLSVQVAPPQQKPPLMCSPNHQQAELRCDCLARHPGWCEEDIPPPECCKRGEKKVVQCGCCASERSQRWVGKLCKHA